MHTYDKIVDPSHVCPKINNVIAHVDKNYIVFNRCSKKTRNYTTLIANEIKIRVCFAMFFSAQKMYRIISSWIDKFLVKCMTIVLVVVNL